MSLLSTSATYAKKTPLQENVNVKMTLIPFGDGQILNYSKASVQILTDGSDVAYLIDFPSEFFNLVSQGDRNNTADAQTLYAHLGTVLKLGEDAVESYELKWFCNLSTFTVPDLLPGHSRIWFSYQDPNGAPVAPLGVMLLEFVFGKRVPIRDVLPVPV